MLLRRLLLLESPGSKQFEPLRFGTFCLQYYQQYSTKGETVKLGRSTSVGDLFWRNDLGTKLLFWTCAALLYKPQLRPKPAVDGPSEVGVSGPHPKTASGEGPRSLLCPAWPEMGAVARW